MAAASSTTDASVLLKVDEPKRSLAFGLFLAVFSQLGWGCYPVFARALQIQPPKLSTLDLIVALNAICGSALFISATFNRMLRIFIGRAPKRRQAATRTAARRLTPRVVLIVGSFAIVTATRASTNIASAAFAPAHWCVMINLCTPIFTATIGRFVFGEPLPAGTLPALIGGLSGSALAIFGGTTALQQQDEAGSGDHSSKSADGATLALGVSLALFSAFSLAVYQHYVRRTKDLLTESFILLINYSVMLIPCGGIVLVMQLGMPSTNENILGSLSAFEMKQWLYLIILALVVYLGANLAQQLAIRRLGATTLSAIMPIRLLSSVLGSFLVLDEGITSIAELLGLLLVGTTATLYLGYQLRVARRKKEQQQAEAAKNKAADGGGAEDDAKGFDMRPIEGLKELHEQEMTETR